uniref:Uncharacterized protein n=1 Tax=Arundo donax TaxID=35708 RepID=A0A0A9EFB8_ARUDO
MRSALAGVGWTRYTAGASGTACRARSMPRVRVMPWRRRSLTRSTGERRLTQGGSITRILYASSSSGTSPPPGDCCC